MATEKFAPGLEGVIATDTAVSYLDVDHEQIVIRGYDLIELAKQATFIKTAYLVIHGALPSAAQERDFAQALTRDANVPPAVYELLRSLPKGTHLMDALRTGLSFLAGYEDEKTLDDTSKAANLAKGMRILAKAPTIAVNAYHAVNGQPIVEPDPKLGYTENVLWMINRKRPTPQAIAVLDRIFICYIEHELPNSTFAARVIVSTLSDIYGGVTGAVASLKGPLHGGANEAAANMLVDILKHGGQSQAESYIMHKLATKARIMGFGHRVYMKKYDPRAFLLRDYLADAAKLKPEGPELHAIYQKVEAVMLREKGLYPNADYPIGLLMYLLDIPIPLFTPLFLCARVPGLVAHVIEQHENNRLYRPRVIYTGPRGLHP